MTLILSCATLTFSFDTNALINNPLLFNQLKNQEEARRKKKIQSHILFEKKSTTMMIKEFGKCSILDESGQLYFIYSFIFSILNKNKKAQKKKTKNENKTKSKN